MNTKEIIPYLTSGWRIPVLLGLMLILLGVIFWAYSDNTKKEGQLIGNIGEANGQNAVIANLVKNAESEANNAETQSNNAETNFNISVNTDSTQFNGDSTDAFCRRFFCDSSCQQWRLRHPEAVCK